MPNQPAANTVTVSFTLPRELGAVVDRVAKRQMTNKSDIIRRALLAYIPQEEAERVMMMMESTEVSEAATAPRVPVKYPKGKKPSKS
jgi:metal-responsive CopG/Arc/MetJ family transcriptional regulator